MPDHVQQLQIDLYRARLARSLIDRGIPAPIADQTAANATFDFQPSGVAITVSGAAATDSAAGMTATVERLVKTFDQPVEPAVTAAARFNAERAAAFNPLDPSPRAA